MNDYFTISARVNYLRLELERMLDDLVGYDFTPEEWDDLGDHLDDVEEEIAHARNLVGDLIDEKENAPEDEEEQESDDPI